MIFLIEYNRKAGQLVTFRTFDVADRTSAHGARLALELDLNRRGISHEVVMLEAPTEAQLRKTHRRYFEDLESLRRLPPEPPIVNGDNG